MGRVEGLPPIVDRDPELERIGGVLRGASQSEGRLLCVRGEAGIGKTRLLQEAMERAERLGFAVGRAAALSESVTTYHPWTEALRQVGSEELLEDLPPPKLLAVVAFGKQGMVPAKIERSGVNPEDLGPLHARLAQLAGDARGKRTGGGGGEGVGVEAAGPHRLILAPGPRPVGAILEGRESELFVEDLRQFAESVGGLSRQTAGTEVEASLRAFFHSGKYEGIDYAKDDPKLRQSRRFENVALGVARKASGSPLLLVLDDLQWADPSSLTLLRYVARNTRRSPVLLLGAYRVEEGSVRPHLQEALQGIASEDLLDEMDLTGLAREHLRDLAAAFLGPHALDDAFVDALWRETGGNPLFVREVLRGLKEDGAIALKAGSIRLVRPPDSLSLPQRVRDVIQARIGRLSKEDRELLEAAAACGTRFTAALLSRVADREEAKVLRGLNTIVKVHGLVRGAAAGYAFDHPAVHEAAAEATPAGARREYHLRAAAWLEIVGGRVDEIGEHYYLAGDPKAVPKLREAAEAARARYANAEAIRFYSESLELVKDEDERARILEGLGDAYELVGAYDKSIEVHRKLLAAFAEGGSAARVRVNLARVLEKKGAHPEAIATLEEALAVLGDGDPRNVTMVLAQLGHVYLLRGEYNTGLQYLNRSLELSGQLKDRWGMATALSMIGESQWIRGELDMALPALLEGADILEKDGPPSELCETLSLIGFVHLDRGDCHRGLEQLKKSLAVAERIGDIWMTASTYNTVGLSHLMLGECDLALESLARSLRICERTGTPWGSAITLNWIGLAHLKRGEHDKALAALERSLKIREGLGDRWGLTYSYRSFAEAYCALGNWERAREYCKRTLDLARQLGLRQHVAASHRVLGMVCRGEGRWGDAIDNFGESLRIFREKGMDREAAESHYEFGLMWAGKGEFGRAKEEMASAAELFQRWNLSEGVERVMRAQEGWTR